MLPLHPGKDRDGREQADWAMDALMELLQTKYKAMNFPSTLKGWQNHSTNMPLVARAKKFAETEYTRRSNVESFDEMYFQFNAAGEKQDKGNCKTQTTVPRRTKEKIMISEILSLVNAFEETPGHKMEENTFWKVLKDITTSLEIKPSEVDKTKEGRSSAEEVLVEANHDLLQSRPNESETPNETEDMDEMDLLAWEHAQEAEDAELEDPIIDATGTSTDNTLVTTNIEEPASLPSTTRIVISDKETVVQIGKDKSVAVRKAKLNKLALTNIVKKGQEKVKKMDIPAIRYRHKCRVRRERKTLQQELDKYLSSQNGSSKFKSITEALKEKGCSELRVEFALMKKGLWIAPSV
jgi:hypothetical protein